MWESIIVNPFANILLMIYKLAGGGPHAFGVAIILFTLLIRLVTYPLMNSQIKSSAKMQELQTNKKWQETQKKYKGDKEKLAQEQMKVYKELGINPLSSCLPLLIQMPIIFALYQSIVRALAASPAQLHILEGAVWQFFGLPELIPVNSQFLWMNLGQPERVYAFGVGIPVLAIIVGITTYIQSKVTMVTPANPQDQTAAMNRSMTLMMPLMLFWFSLNYASGLAVYFIVSNVLGIAQYALMGKVNWKNLIPGRKPQLPAGGKR
ncbi:MAG: Inner membrane protein translocase component YidC short form OxaI-like protein [Anaerolineaceae bacterium]|nr:MAG: Inner membrane protein translocase component YidC short form OxaI-like protein [Anaerolineaceae bacterium]